MSFRTTRQTHASASALKASLDRVGKLGYRRDGGRSTQSTPEEEGGRLKNGSGDRPIRRVQDITISRTINRVEAVTEFIRLPTGKSASSSTS